MPSRLDEAATKYNVPRRYSDWRELLDDRDIDAVIICLPEGLHAPVAIEAAAQGKHVLVEKPMGRNLAECDAMIAAAEHAGVVLMVAQVLRHLDSHLLAKRFLVEGRVGQICRVVRRRLLRDAIPQARRRSWALDPNIAADWLLHGFGSHEYDAILWLLNTRAEEAHATGRKSIPDWPGWSEISSNLALLNGVVAEVTLALRSDAPAWETTVSGTHGTLFFTDGVVSLNGEKTDVPADFPKAFGAQLAEFLECIRSHREPGPSGKNVRETMALLECVGRSLNENRSVHIAELKQANRG